MGKFWKKRTYLITFCILFLGIRNCYPTNLSYKDTIEVLSTYYHSSVGRYTADGTIIVKDSISIYKYRWVAISHDLNISFGDTITIISTICPKLNGKWIVKDRMRKGIRKRIDFLLNAEEIEHIGFYVPHKVILIKEKA